MNILLWVLQVLLALHAAIGAVWKFANSAGETQPALGAIPHGVWLSMSIVELLCVLGLIVPALYKPLAILVPVAALFIVAEMLLFSGLNLFSASVDYGSLIYWLVVAAICAFFAYGRFVLKPV